MKKSFSEKLSGKLSIPEETLGKTALIQLHGRGRVWIEQHKGLLEYGQEQVCVCLHRGKVKVRGKRLSIGRMTGRVLEIKGEISGVELE